MRAGKGLSVALAVTACLAAPGAATASITIGSSLALNPTPGNCGQGLFTNTALASGLTAPIDGEIVRWRLSLPGPGGSNLYRLRILQPVAGGKYRGDGTGPPQMAPSAGINMLTLPVPLPVKAGELVGVDCPAGAPTPATSIAPPTSTYAFFAPGLADGAEAFPGGQLPGQEVLVNADIGTVPSNAFTLGKAKRNASRGTATLSVTVPGPGGLQLSGKDVKAQKAGDPTGATESVTAAGTVKLVVRAKGKAKRKLDATGAVGIRAKVTYTPTGDYPGTPSSHAKKLKLVKQG